MSIEMHTQCSRTCDVFGELRHNTSQLELSFAVSTPQSLFRNLATGGTTTGKIRDPRLDGAVDQLLLIMNAKLGEGGIRVLLDRSSLDFRMFEFRPRPLHTM